MGGNDSASDSNHPSVAHELVEHSPTLLTSESTLTNEVMKEASATEGLEVEAGGRECPTSWKEGTEMKESSATDELVLLECGDCFRSANVGVSDLSAKDKVEYNFRWCWHNSILGRWSSIRDKDESLKYMRGYLKSKGEVKVRVINPSNDMISDRDHLFGSIGDAFHFVKTYQTSQYMYTWRYRGLSAIQWSKEWTYEGTLEEMSLENQKILETKKLFSENPEILSSLFYGKAQEVNVQVTHYKAPGFIIEKHIATSMKEAIDFINAFDANPPLHTFQWRWAGKADTWDGRSDKKAKKGTVNEMKEHVHTHDRQVVVYKYSYPWELTKGRYMTWHSKFEIRTLSDMQKAIEFVESHQD